MLGGEIPTLPAPLSPVAFTVIISDAELARASFFNAVLLLQGKNHPIPPYYLPSRNNSSFLHVDIAKVKLKTGFTVSTHPRAKILATYKLLPPRPPPHPFTPPPINEILHS